MIAPVAPHPDARQCFLVLGMHRSGTSAFAGLVSKLGVNLPDTAMMPGMPSNPFGHFEPAIVVDLHDRLLAELGSGWADPRKLDLASRGEQAVASFRQALEAFLADAFAADRRIVLKDPRTCRVLPLWRPTLEESGCETIPLLIVRNPLGVAKSLGARNALPFGASLALWLRHVLEAEAGTRGMPRSFVRFEHLGEDWRAHIGRMSEHTGAALGNPSQLDRASGFVDEAAIHHVHQDSEIRDSALFPRPLADMAAQVIAAHDLLVTDPDDRSAMKALDQLQKGFNEFTQDFGETLFQLTEQILRSNIALQESDARTQAVQHELDHMKSTLSWQITAPLRKAGSLGRGGTGAKT